MRDNIPRDHLDELIDDVARSMTRAEPSPLLRTAVRARVEQPRRPRLATWRLGFATAAVAVAVIAGRALFDGPDPPTAPPEIESRGAVSPAPPDPGRPPLAAGPQRSDDPMAVPTPDARASETRRLATGPAPAGPAPADDEFVIVEPISDDPLDESPVELELMEPPMPLRAEWVEIEPLSIQ
jgi:hypothetical protein